MTTLWAMRGYPGSGKSTRAREIANETGAVVVCRDDLRMMLHGTYFSGKKELEDEVTVAERAQVSAFLKAGISVVVDATHLEPSYLRKWAKMASMYGAEFKRVDIETPASYCIVNDFKRGEAGDRTVGAEVINRMAKRHPIKNWPNIQAPPTFDPKPVEWLEGLPEAIIVDIDGTLAHMTGRSPYDYTQVHTDVVDEQIRWLVGLVDYYGGPNGVHVLIVSGRDDSCREATQEWLWKNAIPYDELHMRPTGAKDEHGNKLPDYLVKYDLFDQNIRGKYNVRFVLDDRDQVVNLWRSLGLKCLQVQPGDF
ncbi:polynucleotide kinase [Mycobacterium phage Crossroads]|uniref:Polynucleotide kinase n=1 Tax=Mycobacterium phage GuuelaD TaxID=2015819 RepID=A0A286MQI3_9CAUD|nr:polynucleotide kinase [Mycobacterium phage Crossroads]YP_010013043.1 polynucleotide kinase [Mycobacterium phage GuuelaD]AGT13075.1 polynucleotide kinase [Mycobacterium phage Crossroads]ASW31508.1 polynucleotide kinase [Mycobacterium phage GuuelaD]